MSTPQDRIPPESPGDLWERLVREGKTEMEATAAVERMRAKVATSRGKQPTYGRGAALLRSVAKLPFDNEIIGAIEGMLSPDMSMGQAIQRRREQEQQIQAEQPGASMLGGIGQAVAVPGGAMNVAMRAGSPLGGAIGAGVGMAGGLLHGADQAEGSLPERVAQSSDEMLLGALLGGATGRATQKAVDVVPRMFGNRNQRVADRLTDATGNTGDVRGARRVVQQKIEDVRQEFYKPLEEKYKTLDDPELLNTLKHPDIMRFLPASLQRALAKAGEEAVPVGYKNIVGKGMLLDKLRKAAKMDPGLTARIEDIEASLSKLPGHLEANESYRAAITTRDAIEAGLKTGGIKQAAFKIQEAFARTPDEAKDFFRTAQLSELLRGIAKRDEAATGVLNTLMDAGPETIGQLRPLFKSDKALAEFIQIMRKERSAAKLSSALRARWLIPAVGVGGASIWGVTKLF